MSSPTLNTGGGGSPIEGPPPKQKPGKADESTAGESVTGKETPSSDLVSKTGAGIGEKLREVFSKIGARIQKKITPTPKEERDPVKIIEHSKTYRMQRLFQSKEVSTFQDDFFAKIKVGRELIKEISKLEKEIADTKQILSGAAPGANQEAEKKLSDLKDRLDGRNGKRAELERHMKSMQEHIDAFDEYQKGPIISQGGKRAVKNPREKEIESADKEILAMGENLRNKSAELGKPSPESKGAVQSELDALQKKLKETLEERTRLRNLGKKEMALQSEGEALRRAPMNQIGMKLCKDLRNVASGLLQLQIKEALQPKSTKAPEPVTKGTEKTKELRDKITDYGKKIEEQTEALELAREELVASIQKNQADLIHASSEKVTKENEKLQALKVERGALMDSLSEEDTQKHMDEMEIEIPPEQPGQTGPIRTMEAAGGNNQNQPEMKKQLIAIFSDITQIITNSEFRTRVVTKQHEFYLKFYTQGSPVQKADADAAIAFIDEQIKAEASKQNKTFDLTKYEEAKGSLLKLFPS